MAKELAEITLSKKGTAENAIALQIAIENLAFLKYHNQVMVLVNSLISGSTMKQLSLATSLWIVPCNEKDFELVFEILKQHKASCLIDLFQQPGDFKHHSGARYFLIKFLLGNDEYVFEKAQTILSLWAWSGLPELRENSALDRLQFNNRDLPASITAINRLKEILTNIK